MAMLPVHNLGVDDWAWRKGQEYGTILVNLDAHRVVDLLPDRAADSFSEWLRQHPEIVTVSRDRCGIYAEGAALGAPQSQQIADRFHLVLNLSSTMERVLEERSKKLILPPVQTAVPQSQPLEGVEPTAVQPPQPRPTQSQLRRQRRLECYEQVIALFKSGQSQAAISRALGLQRKTIRRWLRTGAFPERKPPHRPPPKVNEFGAYLEQSWNEGCHNATLCLTRSEKKDIEGNAPWWRASLPVGGRPAGRHDQTLPRGSRLSMPPFSLLAQPTR
jgi:hypothetical protein